MRGVVEIEEDSRGRTLLVITELPYQVNHDNFITSIAEQVLYLVSGELPDDPRPKSESVGRPPEPGPTAS